MHARCDVVMSESITCIAEIQFDSTLNSSSLKCVLELLTVLILRRWGLLISRALLKRSVRQLIASHFEVLQEHEVKLSVAAHFDG
jgi:hypothetical protein